MPQKKLYLLRSTNIYNSLEAAIASFDDLLSPNVSVSDGEVVLARYRVAIDEEENPVQYEIKSVLGIYNNKSGISGFTIVLDDDEIKKRINDLDDRIDTIVSQINGVDFPELDAASDGVITKISQQDMQIYADSTDVIDLTLGGYSKTNASGPISGSDSIALALSKLENNDNDVKTVYRGTEFDTVDSVTGEYRLINYRMFEIYQEVSVDTYNNELTEKQQSLYEFDSDIEHYVAKEEYISLTSEEYDELLPDEDSEVTIYDYNITSKEPNTLNIVTYNNGVYSLEILQLYPNVGYGLKITKGRIGVSAGQGIRIASFIGLNNSKVAIQLDETSDSHLSLSDYGLKLDLSDITSDINNTLNSVSGSDAITVSTKSSKSQTISLKLANNLVHDPIDAQYAGEIKEEEVDGETVETVVHNNILQITQDGLYLDAYWDCGDY